MVRNVFERSEWGLTFENEYLFNGSSSSTFKSDGKRTVQYLEKEFEKKLGGTPYYRISFYKDGKEVKKGKFDSMCVSDAFGGTSFGGIGL